MKNEEELMQEYVDQNQVDYGAFITERNYHPDDDAEQAIYEFCTWHDKKGFKKYLEEIKQQNNN